MYLKSFVQHGDTPAALLTPKGRGDLRFRSVDPFVNSDGISILDYGCGLAYFYSYLLNLNRSVEYTGVDIMPEFIEACRRKFPKGTFHTLDPMERVPGVYDIVFASGVFNIRTHTDRDESKDYAFSRLKYLFSICKEVLICDFLSPFVDFEQKDSQHIPVSEVTEFCASHLSRRFIIRHDLLPYEYTLVALKNDGVRRPGNFFEADG